MTTRKHEVPEELLSSLLANYKKPEDLISQDGLLKQLTEQLVERALDAEMTEHLGQDKHEPVNNAAGNTRNGRSRKTLKVSSASRPSRCNAIGTSRSSRSLCPSTRRAGTGSTSASCRCMRAG